jgi:DNA repair exonuclease SbcCD nuclease subunit
MIVTADLHLTEDSEDLVFDEILPGLVDAALKDDHWIAILGDIYHLRYRVSVRLQNRLYNFMAHTPDYTWVLLPGNHDQINPAGEHALEVFRGLSNVIVVTAPEWTANGLWIPYRKDPAAILATLATPKPEGCPPVAWMHHGVRGAMLSSAMKDTDGIPVESFSGFKHVFCGHYHMPQNLGFLDYIGSPYQTRADESGQQKRIGIWDLSTLSMRYQPVFWGRKFHRLEVSVDSPLLIADGVSRTDEIRIKAGPGVDVEELGRAAAEQGFTNVVITPVQAASASRLKVAEGKGLDAYAEEYVKTFAGDLGGEKLMDLYRELT